MKTTSISFSKIVSTVALSAVVSLAVMYSGSAKAANGCGFGYHATIYGRCVPNNPGPNATRIPGRPDCWRNGWGAVRCWR